MTAYEKIMKRTHEYLAQEVNPETAEAFSEEYMDLFHDLYHELEREAPHHIFELLDDLKLVCDYYDKSPEIRAVEHFCLDEAQLRERVEYYVGLLG